MPEIISYEIGDPKFAIQQFQRLYGTPPLAFKEYISNSVDARNISGKDPINLGIIVNKNTGTIIIRDNGIGMTYEEMKSIPKRICLSSNRENQATIGEKGLGLHAYISCNAKKCQLYSRHISSNDNGLFSSLTMLGSSMEAEADLVHARDLPFGEFEHGTEVILSGISQEVIQRYFIPSKIDQLVGDFYSPLIRKGILKATVGYFGRGQKQISIDPIQYKGKLVLDDIVEIEYTKDGEKEIGNIHFYLFIDPESKKPLKAFS